MFDRIYLDWNATAPLRPSARVAMLAALDAGGNPSSVHGEGRAARRLVETARGQVAALVGADPRNVVFTSGGTEANALALTPAIFAGSDRRVRGRLLVSGIEHVSVLAGGRFPPGSVSRIAATTDGTVDLADLAAQLAAHSDENACPLVSIMAANNETGVIQPVAEAARIVHDAGGLLHVDAVQAVGRIEFDINTMGADLVTVSSHKIGGPQGVGALVLRDAVLHIVEPLIRGGGQEGGRRAGTENVAAIVGFGAAAAEVARTCTAESAHTVALRQRLEQGLKALSPQTVLFGEGAERLPNTTLLALSGIKAETALIALDLAGVAVSSGSACSSGKVAASHVLAAMGVAPALARGAIRVSTGFATTEADIDGLLQAWRKCVAALLKDQNIAA